MSSEYDISSPWVLFFRISGAIDARAGPYRGYNKRLMRVFLSNLGCKLNQAELEQLGRQFLAAGHQLVGSLMEADLHVLNSCTVTHMAARDSRKLARRGQRLNPSLRTVLTGCYVESDPEEAAALSGVDLVIPNRDKHRLLERIQEDLPGRVLRCQATGPVPVPYVPLEFGNSRALVKVEDGCNMRCSFCVIPLTTRGPNAAAPSQRFWRGARPRGRWLPGGGHHRRTDLIVPLAGAWTLRAHPDPARANIDFPAPAHFHRPLAVRSRGSWILFSSQRLCRHVHLSLQSGSSDTLRRMRRPYSAEEFADLADHLRQRIPSIAITTDVIVGFPGESDAEFEESLHFAGPRWALPGSMHFPTRPGGDRGSGKICRTRFRLRSSGSVCSRMLAVARKSQERFEQDHAHTTAEVLWEYQRDGAWHGMTDNYLRVVLESDEDLAHRHHSRSSAEPNGLMGLTCELASPAPTLTRKEVAITTTAADCWIS